MAYQHMHPSAAENDVVLYEVTEMGHLYSVDLLQSAMVGGNSEEGEDTEWGYLHGTLVGDVGCNQLVNCPARWSHTD